MVQVDFENRCLKWGKDKTASGTGRILPLSQRAVAAHSFWATHIPGRKQEHYVFPSERYGDAGDGFSPSPSVQSGRQREQRGRQLRRRRPCGAIKPLPRLLPEASVPEVLGHG